MSDDRQQILNTVITALRGLSALNLPELLQQTAKQLAVQYQLTPTEQAAITQSLGVANVFDHANVAQGNIVAGDVTQKTQSGGNSFDGARIEHMGDPVAGNKYEVHYHGTLVDVSQQVADYVDGLRDACCQLPLAEADDFNAEERQIHLDQVYTMLEVASTVPRVHQQGLAWIYEHPRQQTVIEAVNQHGRLVLVGEPGSGKSTVVNYLTLMLATTRTPADLATTLPHWTRGVVVPIRLLLRQFAVWVSDQPANDADHELLWAYLATLHAAELVAFLRQRLHNGTAMLMLDGYDEVPANDHGQPLARVHAALLTLRQIPLVLITCRVLDYETATRHLAYWHIERIIPFSPQLQTAFIARWYATLHTLKRAFNGDPAVLQADLQREVQQRPELRRLAGNPMLLTMMAQLHAYKHRLPDERVQLYAECIELLLYHWRAKQGIEPLPSRLGLPAWSEQNALELLARIGYAAHQIGTALDGETGADVPDDVVLKTIRQYFDTFGADRSLARAAAFVDYIGQQSNGVLQRSSPTTFRFPHRTFQEYLAARRLVSDGDWPDGQDDVIQRLVQVAHNPAWSEVLTLAISQLVQTGHSDMEADVLEALLDAKDRPRSRVVVAELARELLRDLPRVSKHHQMVVRETIYALVQMLDHDDPAILQALRLRAGDALGFLGDPRAGVCDLDIQWCDVPAGTYTVGSDDRDEEADDHEKPVQTVTLEGFRIAKYCITNAQWQHFMDAGGYTNPQWWSEQGWQACQNGWDMTTPQRKRDERRRPWTAPCFWEDSAFNAPNQPVVGVSWYEAAAFCAWLSHERGYLIQLPTDAQWEVAARGHGRPIYPWGDDWNVDNANTSATDFNRPSAVGCYPQGASWCGVLDMAGNIFEWMASFRFSDPTNRIYIIEDRRSVSIRGGSWGWYPQLARSAYGIGVGVIGGGHDLGIRCVCALE